MFASLGSFSVFFFTCLIAIVLATWHEDKLIALEERRIARKAMRKSKHTHKE